MLVLSGADVPISRRSVVVESLRKLLTNLTVCWPTRCFLKLRIGCSNDVHYLL